MTNLTHSFLMYLFHACTCFEHKCSSSGGPNCINTSSGITHSGGWLTCRSRGVSSWPARQTVKLVINQNLWRYLAEFFIEWEMFHTKLMEEIKTHILYSIPFFSESRAVREIMWKNIVERDRQQVTIWRLGIVCWIPMATDTHWEFTYYHIPTNALIISFII
jgi:hypothetical protein